MVRMGALSGANQAVQTRLSSASIGKRDFSDFTDQDTGAVPHGTTVKVLQNTGENVWTPFTNVDAVDVEFV